MLSRTGPPTRSPTPSLSPSDTDSIFKLTPLEGMRRISDEQLDGAGIDVVMLQDGVGARSWDGDLEERIVPFFRMFRAVCNRRGVALWSDLESFRRGDPAQGAAWSRPPRPG